MSILRERYWRIGDALESMAVELSLRQQKQDARRLDRLGARFRAKSKSRGVTK